jgi:hypothetical protein
MDLKATLIIYVPQALLVLFLIIVLWCVYNSNKNEFTHDRESREQKEIDAAIEQPRISKRDFYLLCIKPLTYYLLYFLTIIPALVILFGKIENGLSWQYGTFLIIVGIPFLVSFIHFAMLAEKNRYRLIVSGGNKSQASSTISGLILCVPIVIFVFIWLVLKASNLAFG